MDAHHASLGRRTLQEIRQKRAAERLSKASSGSDLSNIPIHNDNVGIKKSESGNRLSELTNCLKQNEELRGILDKLRTEQAGLLPANGSGSQKSAAEILSLKSLLTTEQSKAEALTAEIMQLSLKLRQATQAYNGLARLYKPVLRNIERSLIKMKQDGCVIVH